MVKIALGTKMFVMMAVITIVLWFAMPDEMSSADNSHLVTGFYGIRMPNQSFSNETVTFDNQSLTAGLDDSNSTGIGTGVVGFISDYIRLQTWARTILTVFLAPMVFMAVVKAPAIITALFGVVWVIMYVIAIASFIRGRDF